MSDSVPRRDRVDEATEQKIARNKTNVLANMALLYSARLGSSGEGRDEEKAQAQRDNTRSTMEKLLATAPAPDLAEVRSMLFKVTEMPDHKFTIKDLAELMDHLPGIFVYREPLTQ